MLLQRFLALKDGKIGQIFAMTPVLDVNAQLAEELFKVYIQPVYDYCAAIWTSNVSSKAKDNMNIVQTKYWKRYFQVPKWSSKEVTYLLSGTIPLTERMFMNPTKQLQSINLSIPLDGYQLNLVKNQPAQEEYIIEKDIPVQFWEILQEQQRIPSNCYLRRKFTTKLYDLNHFQLCNRTKKDFHNHANPRQCKCKNCNTSMDWYHKCQSVLDPVGANVPNVAS